jgi:hypothetical protein
MVKIDFLFTGSSSPLISGPDLMTRKMKMMKMMMTVMMMMMMMMMMVIDD